MESQSNIKLVMIEGPSPGEEFELDQPEMVIGRAPTVDYPITFPAVSGRHALVSQKGGQIYIEDLNSSNGTFINGERLTGRQQLHGGEMISLGQSVILRLDLPAVDKTVLQMPVDATMLEGDMDAYVDDAAVAGAAVAADSFEPEDADEMATRIAGSEALVPEPEPATPKQVPTPPSGGETMLWDDFQQLAEAAPLQLMVAVAGDPAQFHTLQRSHMSIGRADDNDIVIPSKIVSRHHAYLEKVGDGYQIVPLPDIGNPIMVEGRPLEQARRLFDEEKMRIGGLDPGSMVTLTYLAPSERGVTSAEDVIHFGDKTTFTFGRDPSNDVVVDSPAVSRFHAQVERVGQRYRVIDLRSSNGTFVNGVRIDGDVWLQPDDAVRIGPSRFVMGQDQLAQYDESRNLRVEAIALNKWVRKDLNILQDISVVFQPREFVVVVGQSGGGKSTLVDAIAGYRPATDGDVYVNDIPVYEKFDAIRNDIGFVPQRDIIHMELTVFQALDYAAQLRMPPDTTRDERRQRIEEVLNDLDLAHRADVQISGLSGGQQKRVSIGVELLTKPGLFYLDEPTSGLDPGTETALMHLMRRLADQGRTITLITHATKNVMLADKVVFLARGGYLTWFGPPDEALAFFDQYRSERARRAKDIEFDEIYGLLDDESLGAPTDWAQRYREHPAYEKYITEPLRDKEPESTGQFRKPAPPPVSKEAKRQISSWRQFLILSSRNIKILTRDRFSLVLMLAAPPLVSLLDVILAVVLGRNPFAFEDGSMPNVMITLFLLTVYGVMVGGLSQMREIVKEQDVYKRERLVNLRLFPYIVSKVWVAALLAIYASAVYMIVHYLAFDMPGGTLEFVLMFVSLALATMAGMMLGLFSSALAPNPNAAPLIVVLLMLPQIVLGGALVPLPEAVTTPISTRWAFQAFMGITGVGSDVAADACWELPDEIQKELTLDQKNENCRCLGANALNPDSCNYPGIGQFRTAVLDSPPPEAFNEPQPVRPEEPPRPELPEQPEQPEDQSDLVAMAEYQEQLEAYQEEAGAIQAAYEAQLEQYRAQLGVFEAEAASYQESIVTSQQAQIEYQIATNASILPAEELIRQFKPGFGWTYVDKTNSSAYWGMITTTWIAQFVIIAVLFVGTLFLQKRKDKVQ